MHFAITGDAVATSDLTTDDITQPITDADVQGFVRVLARMAKMGRTGAQAKAILQAGVTVTV